MAEIIEISLSYRLVFSFFSLTGPLCSSSLHCFLYLKGFLAILLPSPKPLKGHCSEGFMYPKGTSQLFPPLFRPTLSHQNAITVFSTKFWSGLALSFSTALPASPSFRKAGAGTESSGKISQTSEVRDV